MNAIKEGFQHEKSLLVLVAPGRPSHDCIEITDSVDRDVKRYNVIFGAGFSGELIEGLGMMKLSRPQQGETHTYTLEELRGFVAQASVGMPEGGMKDTPRIRKTGECPDVSPLFH